MKALFIASLGSLAIQPILDLFLRTIYAFPKIDFTLWNRPGNDWMLVIIVALAHLLFLGLPIFSLLKRYQKVSLVTMVMSGLIVGLVPIAITNITSMVSCCDCTLKGSSTRFIGQTLCNNGLLTFQGWLYVASRSWLLGLHGAIGALVFYLLWLKFSWSALAN